MSNACVSRHCWGVKMTCMLAVSLPSWDVRAKQPQILMDSSHSLSMVKAMSCGSARETNKRILLVTGLSCVTYIKCHRLFTREAFIILRNPTPAPRALPSCLLCGYVAIVQVFHQEEGSCRPKPGHAIQSQWAALAQTGLT